MMTSSILYAGLRCHPAICGQAVREIEAGVKWTESGTLALTYILKGNLTHLRIPPPRPPRRADRLWEHTCFEVFVAAQGKLAYYEFNLAPSGEWAAYAFRRYREGAPLVDKALAPMIAARSTKSKLDLDAVVHLNRLPTLEAGTPLRLGLAAVIEENDGMLSYWALRHTPGKPDFHHPDAFALEIEIPHREPVKPSVIRTR
jgi:hypothetical protein